MVVGGYEEGAPNHTIKCSVCGQKKDEAHADRPGDVRDDEWQRDGTNHWHKFACGTIMDKAAHTWNAGCCDYARHLHHRRREDLHLRRVQTYEDRDDS